MNKLLTLGATATVALLACTGLSTAAPPDLGTSAVFNKPDGTEIVDHLIRLIKGAEPGSDIRVAAFRIRDNRVADPLIAAADRGVNIKVVADSGTAGFAEKAYEKLANRLGTDTSKQSWAKLCDKGKACIGNAGTPVLHSKFFLFSKTLRAADVVVLPTANLNFKEGGTGGWNSVYTDVGNKALYERHKEYFDDLKNEDKDTDYYNHNKPETTGNTKSYFHPRAQGDTYVNILDGVACDGTRKTHIRISNWWIARTAVATKLQELSAKGCSVDIVANQISRNACTALTKPAGRPAIHGFSAGKREHGTHEKNMMIDGKYLGSYTKVTFTGTHNLTPSSLKENDENTIRITDAAIHDRFVENFTDVKNAADVAVDHSNPGKSCDKLAPTESRSAAVAADG
jgi:phosphatidylserine/phosphatidylglycerophosphate/cardiolipin synthase-like enzyme